MKLVGDRKKDAPPDAFNIFWILMFNVIVHQKRLPQMKELPPLQASVVDCYTVMTCQSAFTQSVRYFLWWDLSPAPSSSCALYIAHLFVYVVGNCSKSKCHMRSWASSPSFGWLVYSGAASCHSSTSQLPPPVNRPSRLTHFHRCYDAARRGPGVSLLPSHPPSLAAC